MRRVERQIMTLQGQYEQLAERRNALQRAAHLLLFEGIEADGTVTWATVCRLKGWPSSSSAHVIVKRRDPRLHALLHRASLGQWCALDKARYPLE